MPKIQGVICKDLKQLIVHDLPIKLQILSKLEYKSDTTESATGMLRMVWFPFMDLELKEFKRISVITHNIQIFLS